MTNIHMKSCLPLLMVLLALGCDNFEEPAFRLNMVSQVQGEISREYQQDIANVLHAMFGSPDDPHVLPEMGLDLKKLRLAAGPAWSDQQGTNHGLYRKHCVHCHGIDGDGEGPTARFLNPYPRDFRYGIFKFKSTYNPDRPTDDDLHRTLVNGIPGTAMPSFSLLPNSEVESLLEYVKYLSMRGQMELQLIDYVQYELGMEEAEDEQGNPILDENGNPVLRRIPLDPQQDPEQREIIMDSLAMVVEGWENASERVIMPDEEFLPQEHRTEDELAESIAKGRELFYGSRANCVKCHGTTALGDGQQTDFDHWNKLNQAVIENSLKDDAGDEFAALRAAIVEDIFPVRNAFPRNLREGVYRGGRRPIDIFWRIYAGIAGTPMPGVGSASPGATGTLTEDEIWQLVDYILSLPYEASSKPLEYLPENMREVY